jgi:RNA polymerase sigma-70 factor, ECF subfamily
MRSGTAILATSLEGEHLFVVTDEVVTVGDRELVALAPTLLAAARYLVRSEADAADLVQTTLEIAVRRRSQLRDPGSLRAWLLAIEAREAFRLRRRLRMLVSLEGRGVTEVAVDGPSTDDLAVRQAVAKLPPRMRTAVVLHHLAALPVAQTAEAMGVSQNTVKTLLRLGLARLREVLA